MSIYLPDELALAARAAGLNVSGVAQDALRRALGSVGTDRWLDGLPECEREVSHERVLAVIDDVRDELGDVV
ncbi:MAG: type II toxin-antitoxin system CcdA family antitoxin [Solirubrobacteraceae bacterium]